MLSTGSVGRVEEDKHASGFKERSPNRTRSVSRELKFRKLFVTVTEANAAFNRKLRHYTVSIAVFVVLRSLKVLTGSPNSTDLSPIKHLWDVLAKQVQF